MPRKRRNRTQEGANIFNDIYDKVLKPVGNGLKQAHDYVKDKKLISKTANAIGSAASYIPHPYAQKVAGTAKTVGNIAGQLGYGKAHAISAVSTGIDQMGGRRRKMVGGSSKAIIGKAMRK